MRLLKAYGKQKIWVLLLLALCAGIFAVVLSLYDLPAEAAGYAALLCAAAAALWWGVDFVHWRRRVRSLEGMVGQAALLLDTLPEPWGPQEEAYQELLRELDGDRRRAVSDADARARKLNDYYTLWVHQIKTPISAMGLMLQGDDSQRGRELAAELFRVERYVELVLSYLRLDSETTDYLIAQYPLDAILRQAVRRYAPLFIRGKVSLDLADTDLVVLTDEKWLQLVVEQVICNAVKYAPGGQVKIYTRGTDLVIRDNGVGIAPEDLPRVFERGFTGCNGRLDKRSTGIGLYLCKKICTRLGHTISAEATPGQGTAITIGLARPELDVE